MYGLKMCLGSDHYKPALLAPVRQLWCSLEYSVLNNSMPLPGHFDPFTMETDVSPAQVTMD